MPRCATCTHFSAEINLIHRPRAEELYDQDAAELGQCRRQPPQLADDGLSGVWPTVADTDWCGDHARCP